MDLYDLVREYEHCVDLGELVRNDRTLLSFDMSYFGRGTVEFVLFRDEIVYVDCHEMHSVRLNRQAAKVLFKQLRTLEI